MQKETLETLRHSASHLLAQAMKELFPTVKLAIGPAIEDGFYYDFLCEENLSEDELSKIEEKMMELSKRNLKIEKEIISREEAIELFSKLGEKYKVELVKELPANEEISIYKQGDFVDLCRGPHVESTGKIKAFKLTKLSGAYWRADANNEVLQRIYGTAWFTEDDLNSYLQRIEEAKKRDHRLIGKKLDLFHFQDEAPGLVFWHPCGWTIYKTLRNYLANKVSEFGYQEVFTPIILDRVLWEQSGHWDNYADKMFITSSENHTFSLKPMNCPGHIQIFNHGLKSYRDLPVRFAEFGLLHRNEYSGTLHGLFRVRGFVTDDGHIFCTEEQIASEASAFIDQLFSVYADFGFKEVTMHLATRPKNRVGTDEMWDKSEKALTDALNKTGMPWELAPLDGAFYGSKIDFYLKDCLGRKWQCGTFQVDFSMPDRLGAFYVAEDGVKKHPVILHRAMFGSIERFIGILLEETAGNLPFWLTPIQVVVLNITDNQSDYANKVHSLLLSSGFRVKLDLSNEKIGFKIRKHSMQRVHYLVIIGDKELKGETVTIRKQDGSDLGSMSVNDFISMIKLENKVGL